MGGAVYFDEGIYVAGKENILSVKLGCGKCDSALAIECCCNFSL